MRRRGRVLRVSGLVLVIAVSGTASAYFARQEHDDLAIAAITASAGTVVSHGSYRYERLADPPRTVVATGGGAVVATLTDGARTVVLSGPARTFSDPKQTSATVTTTAWVRLAPQAWTAGAEHAAWFGPWLASVVGSTTPDVLAVAMQYLPDAPSVMDNGLHVAGDASFGPGADFERYLGIGWRFPDDVRVKPDPKHTGALDSSGYVRMVYGYREGYPLLGRDDGGAGLPPDAPAMAESGPGTVIVPDTGQRATDYSRLQPGDLLFFALSQNLGEQVTQVGIYLGIDSDGHRRVLSCRASADGPTFGDAGGGSFIDGDGKYARAFRAAKRL